MKSRISKNFHVPLNSLSIVKTAKSSLPRGHMAGGGGGGGAIRGTWSWDPGPPPWIRGSIYKKKVPQDPGPNTHTAATIRKEFLTPPPKGVHMCGGGGGGTGVKIQKIIGGSFLVLKMMILQGVVRRKPYIGVCYTKDPEKRGYTKLAPALDLTTSLEVILVQHFCPCTSKSFSTSFR